MAAPASAIERTTFQHEQERRRQQSFTAYAICGIVGSLMALALSLVLSPLILFLGLILGGLVKRFVPLPLFDSFYDWLGRMPDLIEKGQSSIPSLIAYIVVLIAPGFLMLIGFALWSRRVRTGPSVRELARAMGASDPEPHRLDEQRLVNIVEEMAIASGLSKPVVLLVDAPGPNVAVIGRSRREFAILVTRPLLPQLDRDETQGTLAAAIASVANGDLGVLETIRSMVYSMGLVNAFLDSPFSKSQRSNLWAFAKLAFTPRNRRTPEQVLDLERRLLNSTQPEALSELDTFMQGSETKLWIKFAVFGFLLLPFLIARVASLLIFGMMNLFVVGPLLSAAWKSRRYLADASAVQYTRNPCGFGNALVEFSQDWSPLGDDPWVEMTSVVSPSRVGASSKFGEAMNMAANFSPSVNRRIMRLQAMGADIDYVPYREPNMVAAWALIFGVIGILAALVWGLSRLA
ncbi:MAG: hypothetical protein K1X67_00580 [Fimbriimonadaceae bacterium]|nr:hypothetical protein [Fimbriimonadaceae bacterium]